MRARPARPCKFGWPAVGKQARRPCLLLARLFKGIPPAVLLSKPTGDPVPRINGVGGVGRPVASSLGLFRRSTKFWPKNTPTNDMGKGQR